MKVRLYNGDDIRVTCDHSEKNFIDIRRQEWEAMSVDAYPSMQYIEIRKKNDQLRIYFFKKKSDKKECLFGWWEDSEVVFSINNVHLEG